MNDSIISYWRDARGAFRSVTALVLTTFVWMQMYPVAAAAKDAIEGSGMGVATAVPASFTHEKARVPSNVDPQRATMEALSKTLNGMHAALKKHRDLIVKRKDKKGNLHITIIGTKADVDLTGARKDITRIKQELVSQDQKIDAEFRRDGERIKSDHLPFVIQQRHDDAVAKYEKNREDFRKGLDVLGQSQDLNALLSQTDALLKGISYSLPKHAKFDPKSLPFGTEDGKVREPAIAPETLRKVLASNLTAQQMPTLTATQRNQEVSDTEIAAIQKASKNGETYPILAEPIKVASLGSMSGLLAMAAVIPPSPEYLTPTEDVQITPAIQALATQLHHNPVEIYNWVHDNIEYLPTYGSIQGSDVALQTKRGNAFDISSLLIALLRTSGIPARYVYGTVEIPIDQAKNWVGGVVSPNAVLQLLGQGGIPNIGLAKSGKIFAVRMEHVWVEAFVDGYPSRGSKNIAPENWVPMDASFKQYALTQGMNVQQAVPANIQVLLSQVQASPQFGQSSDWVKNVSEPTLTAALQTHQQNLRNYVNNVNPNATVADVLGGKNIINRPADGLSVSLPYHLVVRSSAFAVVPMNLRHQVEFKFYASADDQQADAPSFTIQRSMPSLAGHRVSFIYEPDTAADKQVIDQAAQNYQASFPAYEVNMRPSLKVEGDVIQSGTATVTGTEQILVVSVETPWYAHGRDYQLTSGDYMALIVDPAGVTLSQLDARTQVHDLSGGDDAQFTEEMFYQIGLGYWLEEKAFSDVAGDLNHVATRRLPSHGMAGAPISVVYSYGTPRSATYKSRILDVKEIRMIVEDKNDNHDATVAFVRLRGIIASFLESSIYDQSFLQSAGQSLSAVTALQIANKNGLPIYKITGANIGAVMPQLQIDSQVKSDIANAAASGYEITVPQRNLTVGTFNGAGYIITDPATGSGQYLISGGRNGNSSGSGAASYPLPQIPATPIYGLMVGGTVRSASAGLLVNNGVLDSFVFSSAAVGAGGETAGGSAVAGLGPLGLVLAALIACLAVASASEQAIEKRYPRTFRVFRHYTTSISAPLIDATSTIIAGRDGGDFGFGVYTEEPPDANVHCPMSDTDVANVMYRYNIDPKYGDRDAYVEFAITRSGYWERVIEKHTNNKGVEETLFHLLFIYYGPFAVAIERYGACY